MIELRDVTYYRKTSAYPVLDRVSLSIPAGQWVSVAGPNGSGKSTLLRLLNGLLRPQDGAVVVNGALLASDTLDRIRAQIGVVFQNPENQFVGQTVIDDIVFGLENRCLERETMRQRVQRYAEQLCVTDLLHRHPSTLSGGQMQRAALAAVLAMEPHILLFDEAASMLDEAGRQQFLSILEELHATGRYTIITVTHDTGEMLASERLIALHEGKIIADRAPMDVLTDERLLRRLRLVPPYMKQLVEALQAAGIDIGDVWDEKELMDTLWTTYDANM